MNMHANVLCVYVLQKGSSMMACTFTEIYFLGKRVSKIECAQVVVNFN